MHAETATAWATLGLAVGTVGLAFFTYRLARSANESERANWRPILIPATDNIEAWGENEFRIQLKNVGRGPALGVNGQLRIAGPSGATKPGAPAICEVGAIIDLFFVVKGEHAPGAVREMEIAYYDVGESWHVTDLTGFPVKAADGGGFRIASVMSTGELGRKTGYVSQTVRGKSSGRRARLKNGYRLWKARWLRRLGH